MPSIAWKEPAGAATGCAAAGCAEEGCAEEGCVHGARPAKPNSEMTPSMSTISRGLSRAESGSRASSRVRSARSAEPAKGPDAARASAVGSLARIEVRTGNVPGSSAASKAAAELCRWAPGRGAGTPIALKRYDHPTRIPLIPRPELDPPRSPTANEPFPRPRHPPRARVRVRGQPRLLLQVPGRQCRPERGSAPSAALRADPVRLEVVHDRHDRRDRQLGAARSRSHAGADVRDPGP